MKRLYFLIFLISNFYILASSPSLAHAANPKNTITVLPQLTQLDLAKDKPEATIYYTNNSSISIELALSVQDVRELEDRNPVGILDPKDAANYKYSLSSWVRLDRQTIILHPGETGSVIVSIDKDKLSPGGHYGSVLAEIKQSDTDGKTIKIKGILASLLFVRASTGNEIEEAKIQGLGPSSQGINFPDEFAFRFQNTGNVDATPYGLLEIKDSGEKLIAKGIVNSDSSITLPEAIRKYVVAITPTQSFILPGKYTATLSVHFGKSNKKIIVKSTFTTIGSTQTVETGFWIVLLGIVAFLLFKLNGFNYVIRQLHNIIKRTSRN